MKFLKQKNICILLLVTIPFIFLLYMIYSYSVDIPTRDDWAVAGLIDKYYRGVLTWYDLFVQHNEHRLFFPYLIMLPTAILSKWDVRYWILFNVIFGTGIFIALFWQTLSTARAIRNDTFLWILPLSSVLVFSLRPYDNWLMGFQIIVYMNVLCTTVSILILSRLSLGPTAFAIAVLLGFVGSFSFASGMLIWPIGFFVLWFNNTEKHLKKIYLIIWILISISTVLLYLYNYQKPSHHPPLTVALENPLAFLGFVFSYLASPFIATKSILAPLAGLSGTVVLVYAAARLWRTANTGITVMLPYLALGLYSILNAIIMAVGRVGWGLQEALNTRYVTHAIFFWIALAATLLLYHFTFNSSRQRNKLGVFGSPSLCIIIGLSLICAVASFLATPRFFERYMSAARLRTEILVSSEEDFALGKVSYTYHRAFKVIREHNLAVFRQ